MLKFSISANYFIFSFLIWLLVGREDLENDKIGNNENGVGTANCEKFFLNYIDRCAISLHSANLVIDKATIETASTY
jgi:hypothetical protein